MRRTQSTVSRHRGFAYQADGRRPVPPASIEFIRWLGTETGYVEAGEGPALDSHTPVRAFSGVRRRSIRSVPWQVARRYPTILSPPEEDLEGMGS